jgi:hypothetical protein
MGPSGCRKAVVLHHWHSLWNKRHGEACSGVVVSPELWRTPQGGKKGNRPRRPHKGKGALRKTTRRGKGASLTERVYARRSHDRQVHRQHKHP